MITAGIIGGAGYTAGELLRILISHPEVEIAFVHSQSQTGKALYAIHSDLLGETDLNFIDQIDGPSPDVLFFCGGHGRTLPFLQENNIPEETKIIDLSRDFRLKAEGNTFVYGLPELNRTHIQDTAHLANPGCFATCIQLGLLPLAARHMLEDEVHIHAITGSTGAGAKPLATTHFSWRNNNISAYKMFEHQHLGEIRQSLKQLQPQFSYDLNFIPMRGDFPRGIFASMYLNIDITEEVAKEIYQDYYEDHPFVFISEANPHLKQVVNTNKGIIYLQKHENKLLIISMIDNLLKGASGQAVQNMNLMFGLDERTGLGLKALAF